MNRWILIFLVVSSLFILTETRRKQEVMKQEEQVEEQKVTVLQSLHFQSETQKKYSVDIDDIVKDKPVVFLLQRANQQQTDRNLEENPLTVTITSGSEKKECTINHLYGLCSLPKPNSNKGTLKIECKKTPCNARWKLQQPQTLQIDGNHTLNHLVSVNEYKNHAMISVFCQDPQIRKELDDKIEMFTNSKYEKVVNYEGEVIFFFDNEQKGEYFISTGDKAIEACAVARIQHAQDTIQLSSKGQEITDFFISQKANIYQIKNSIDKDLEINMFLHDSLMQKMRNNTKLDIIFNGYNGKESSILSKLSFDIENEKDFEIFSLIFKKPAQKHDRYEIHVITYADHFLIANMRFIKTDEHLVQLSEQGFFNLKKGQKINYKLIPLEQEQKNINTIYIGLSDNKALSSTKESCDRKGCEFTIQALEDVGGSLYIGEDVKNKKSKQIVQEQFQKSIGAKLREGQGRVYLYKMKKDNAIQMLVNSPNVIVYVANKAACSASELFKCHQKQINSHNPSIYQSKQDIELVFLVRALDNANFVLSIVDAHEPLIQLKDTEPFVYLMDSNEEHVVFNFKIQQKNDVSFNLIAPLKELNMLILNKEGYKYDNKDQQQGQLTSQGSITFAKADLKSRSFIIVISKREQYKDKYVHFSLIASTKQTNLILQPSNAHYEKLPVKAVRDYMFTIYHNKKLFLNFHVQNQKTPKIGLKVSKAADYKDKDKTVQFTIDKQTDVLSLETVAQRLCQAEQSQCQIFARLTNEMQNDVQVTITLMVENAIIELKDGIWQNYDLNQAASTSHFYFLPKHQKHSTTIFYHSTLVDLQVAYRLWRSDDTSLDVTSWPFPNHFDQQKSQVTNLQFKPSRFIHIDVPELQKCWPNCVVLLSIIPNKKQLDELDKNPTPLFNINHSFKIMASNNLIQIPQKHKMDIILNRDQEKFLLVDLKQYMQRQTIVFFINTIVGSTILKGNVYTQNNPRCPTMEQLGADFIFSGIETQLAIEDIKKKLEENKMSNDKSPYLCLLSHAYAESKFSIEFVPEAKQLKTLQIDTTTTVKLLDSQVRLFQIHAYTEFYLKISRIAGFPYISHKLCNKTEEMQSCLQEFINSDDKGAQLVNKIMPLSEKPCMNCMFYVKVTAAELSQISIHAQSKFIQIQLKQNSPLTDAVASGQVNKYLITGVRDKQLNINIQVISGQVKVQLNDFGTTKVNKQSKGSNNIHIAIPPKQLQNAKTSASLLNSFLFSANFLHLHITIQSKDSKSPAAFTISYSNGDIQTYLEDGLISQFSLASKKISTFLYNNPSSNQIYLHLSTSEASILNNLKVNIYSLQNANDEDQRQDLKVQKQNFKKKTVNPTMLMHLPAKSHYEIEVKNDNSKEVQFFIGVNDREIIYLPVDHEFPFRLLNKQYLYLVVPASKAGYLRFTLNKCDSSQPYISYTDSYKDFIAESFQTEEQIADTLIYDNVIKVKKAGSLYFKIRAQDTAQSVLTVKASFNTNKIDLKNAKAGNKGNLQYSFVDSQNAEITYSGVVCDKNCGDFSYSLIQSNNISSIIAQLVCSSVSFDLFGFSQTKQAEVVPIKPTTTKDNKLSFNFPVKEDINYVGVKAVNAKSGAIVYYQPLEITTIKGKISRVMQAASEPQNMSWLIGIIVVVSIIVSLIAFRRYQKKKNEAYRPLNYDQMQDSVN